MIVVTDINGRTIYLAPEAIASITEAGTSSQWHGIRAIVKTFDGQLLECRETAEQIARAMGEAAA
jgi:hypothetical protein